MWCRYMIRAQKSITICIVLWLRLVLFGYRHRSKFRVPERMKDSCLSKTSIPVEGSTHFPGPSLKKNGCGVKFITPLRVNVEFTNE